MLGLEPLARWLDVRPDETRKLGLLFTGAFFIIAFMILARALREGLYLGAFDVRTLPYITIAIAVLSVPTVGLFARLLAHRKPKNVLLATGLVVGIALAMLWPIVSGPVAIVAFYLLTSLATLLLTSGFWVIASEQFAIRGAKRTFGLIGAGGTAGAMLMGNALVWLTPRVSLGWLILMSILLLALFLVTQAMLPHAVERKANLETASTSIADSFAAAWRSPHLRTIALIVAAIAIAATLLDYQFKDLAQARFASSEQLTSFFGAFYGWTGGVALVLQLFFVARFLKLAGIAASLALTPLLVLAGSLGLLLVPSLVLVTLVRGGDASLRKSIYRSALEVLYVPVPPALRRKTKTFIDSVVDAGAEGFAAALIFFWVTLADLPARYLSLFVVAFTGLLVYLSSRMGGLYFRTVTEQLKEGSQARESDVPDLAARDLISGTFTRLDVRSLIEEAGIAVEPDEETAAPVERPRPDVGPLERLESPDAAAVTQVLTDISEWDVTHVPALVRLLARDPLYDLAAAALRSVGGPAVPYLAQRLIDEDTEFVIRRRLPRVLSRVGGAEADAALLDALSASRFEVRYRTAIALVHRRALGLPEAQGAEARVWSAIRREMSRDRPVWELQRLLDSSDPAGDGLVTQKTDVRGSLSLEHTFRLLTVVLPPEPIHAAFHAVMSADERLRSFGLEYLEQTLPEDVRDRLWPFIGDVSEYQRERAIRPLEQVVSDLMTTGATLFGDESARAALRRLLEERER